MNTTTTPALCRHLRTKRMYAEGSAEELFAEREPQHASPCHVWCNRTQTVKGLDDRPVNQAACTSGRACFEA
jgi:hypothetical protein